MYIINDVLNKFFSVLVLTISIVVYHVSETFAVGHLATNGQCYAYYVKWGYNVTSSYPYGLATIAGPDIHGYYYLDTGSYSGMPTVKIVWASYYWNNYYKQWWQISNYATLTTQAKYEEILGVISKYGASEGVLPNSYAPNGCTPSCEEEKAAKRMECDGDENVDWFNWSDETCTGAVCKSATSCNFGSPDVCQ